MSNFKRMIQIAEQSMKEDDYDIDDVRDDLEEYRKLNLSKEKLDEITITPEIKNGKILINK